MRHCRSLLGFLWRKYYWFKDDIFAEIDNCFALTIHNSQGSTFDEVGLDINDILTRLLVGKEMSSKQKLKEYHRLLYVGTSRCRQRILFVPPISSRVQLVLAQLAESGSTDF